MRFIISLLSLFLMAVTASATATPLKSILVSWPSDTLDSIVEAAKKVIVEQGGEITHEYTIIKGFAAKAPASAYDFIISSDKSATVEEDQVVSIAGGSS